MAEIKFTGVTYDYNNVTINIAEGAIGISAIGISGVTIGTAADYDRIANLAPTVCKINDCVDSIANTACPVVGVSAITMKTTNTGGNIQTLTLKKIGNKLNCRVSTL